MTGELDRGRLGAAVRDVVGFPSQAGARRDVDDRAAAALQHGRDRVAAGEGESSNVDREDAIPEVHVDSDDIGVTEHRLR
jgi:hypothetical protein